ncbi:MAG: carboxypeptidase-like regulatory domain-containing protein [Flavobacteriaceae bacterium]|nr:carboxypeptidase-like regulatory domain-containing protein [Flavobacteriaceae bacterium]
MGLKKTFLLLILFFSICVCAQEVITGTILNTEANIPVVYANVYISNTSIGTITNNDGQFKLVIPEKYRNKKLLFSLLGFETQEREIVVLQKQSNIVISMSPVNELLEEVVILARKVELDALEIVEKAFDNYTNFASTPYVAKGFIRHLERTEKEYKWLVEGAFEMYDPGYFQKENVKVNIIETRKSLDNRNLDTARVLRLYLHDSNNSSFKKNLKKAKNFKTTISSTELDRAFAYYDNHFTASYNKKLGLLEKILSTDINKIRNYNQKNASFREKSLKSYLFKIDTILGYGDESVYKIKFSKPNKSSSKLDVGWLYVRAKDYAIIKMDYSVLLGKSHHRQQATGERVLYTTNIKFKEYDKKMYPFYMSHKTFKINNFIMLRNSDSIEKEKLEIGHFSHEEILFSEIITQNEELAKIIKSVEFWNDNLFQKRKYNTIFWKNYNILLESEEQQKIIQDLEKKVKLKDQFKK